MTHSVPTRRSYDLFNRCDLRVRPAPIRMEACEKIVHRQRGRKHVYADDGRPPDLHPLDIFVLNLLSRSLGIARVEFLGRSEEHTSELQSLMRTSYDVFCLKQKRK